MTETDAMTKRRANIEARKMLAATRFHARTLPKPLAMDDRHVVLTTEQWAQICVSRNMPEMRPYVPGYAGCYSRHVIVQDTLGM